MKSGENLLDDYGEYERVKKGVDSIVRNEMNNHYNNLRERRKDKEQTACHTE